MFHIKLIYILYTLVAFPCYRHMYIYYIYIYTHVNILYIYIHIYYVDVLCYIWAYRCLPQPSCIYRYWQALTHVLNLSVIIICNMSRAHTSCWLQWLQLMERPLDAKIHSGVHYTSHTWNFPVSLSFYIWEIWGCTTL